MRDLTVDEMEIAAGGNGFWTWLMETVFQEAFGAFIDHLFSNPPNTESAAPGFSAPTLTWVSSNGYLAQDSSGQFFVDKNLNGIYETRATVNYSTSQLFGDMDGDGSYEQVLGTVTFQK